MATISKPHTYSSGTTISSSQANANFDTIYNAFNGNISAANLADGAVTTAKIADINVTTAKLAANAVTTEKITDGDVTSAKLAEAFLRGEYQASTTDSSPTGLLLQHGWTYTTGNGTEVDSVVITFPTAYAADPIVIATFQGQRATTDGTPEDAGWFNTFTNAAVTVQTNPISPTGFTFIWASENAVNLATSQNYGGHWIAIGTPA